jgi:GNAT superfamily N-acetyltransferase
MIRKCSPSEFNTIYDIINNAAQAYKGIIPEDRWHEPYMTREELENEIQNGILFWGFEEAGRILGVMGIQDKGEVTLIRHSYVLTEFQRRGIGTRLLRRLESITHKPILIGTWAHAWWAVSFYRKNGFTLLPHEQRDQVLRTYWSIPERQVETSVVLADRKWMKTQAGITGVS